MPLDAIHFRSCSRSLRHTFLLLPFIIGIAIFIGCSSENSGQSSPNTAEVTEPYLYKNNAGNVTDAEFMKAALQPTQARSLRDHPELTRITLYECGGIHADFLNQCDKLPALRELHLIRSAIDDDAIKAIAELRQLEFLTLSSVEVTRSQIELLTSSSSLQRLTLSGSMPDEAIGALAKLKQLQYLEISTDGFAVESLAECEFPNLRGLKLPNDPLTDAEVAQLPAWRSIESLEFPAERLTDDGLRSLMRYPRLTRLILHQAKITDDGIAHLKELSSLEHLDLFGCAGVTNDSLASIAALPALNFIQLERTGVTGAGLELLATSATLRYVGIGETQAKLEQTSALAALMPECEIDRIRQLP